MSPDPDTPTEAVPEADDEATPPACLVLAEYLRRAEAIGDADELVGEVESFLATEAE